MKNLKKKGFTIVELVIVIAVIAILSAVLIPTFSNLIRKANVSADTQLVKQLNQALAVEEVENGKNVTMYDALETVKEYGFDVTKINAKANLNEILWDSKNNIFVYYDNDAQDIKYIPNSEPEDEATDVDLWKIYNDEDVLAEQKYSIYWNKTEAFPTDVVLTVGFDAGNNALDVNLKYETTSTQTVVIRTNVGKLTVNAENSTVNHYGNASEVYVEKVSANTYNLFGHASYVEASANQHVVLKEGSSVINVFSTTPGSIEVKNDQEVEVITSEEAKENALAAATMFAGGLGTVEKPFLIANRKQLENITEKYDSYNYYKVVEGVQVIDCSKWSPLYLNGSFDGSDVLLDNLDAALFKYVGIAGNVTDLSSWSNKKVELTNFEVNLNIEGSLDSAAGLIFQVNGNNTTLISNVQLHGKLISGSNGGSFVCYSSGNSGDKVPEGFTQEILIENCYVDATLVCASGMGVVSGYIQYGNPNIKLIISNPSEIWDGKGYTSTGKINIVTAITNSWPVASTPYEEVECEKLSKVAPEKIEDGYTIKKAPSASRVNVYISAQLNELDGPSQGITMSIDDLGTFNFENDEMIILDKFNEIEVLNNQNKYDSELNNNKLTIYLGSTTEYVSGSIKLTVAQYDINGNIVSIGSLTIVEAAKDNPNNWMIK